MPEISTIIGVAGSGKTTHLLDLIDKILTAGHYDPREIGFVSFTRAARQEAADRAASRFNLRSEDLTVNGWFRTLHSVCYRQLAPGDGLLGPGRETQNWISAALGEEVSGSGEPNPEDGYEPAPGATSADLILSLWHLARNRLVPFSEVHSRAVGISADVPGLEECRRVVERYEQAKRLDGRCDFTDLLSRFSGWAMQFSGPLQVTPQGEVPEVPVWLLDESQDNTALIDAVARRLTADARWVYLVGDPFQAVYGFNGADPSLFQSWDEGRRRVLSRSYRCPAEILNFGERCLKSCSDYWDRGVEPNAPGGSVEWTGSHHEWLDELDPTKSTLILARTNFQVRRLMGMLRERGVPWEPVKGNGGWKDSKRRRATAALLGLQKGDAVSFSDWRDVLSEVPVRVDNTELFVRGTKKEWETKEPETEFDQRFLGDTADWGATEAFRSAVADGRWRGWVEYADDFCAAHSRWGWDGVLSPKIRLGTIHSAKGMEADTAIVMPTTSRIVWASAQDQEGADEESRLAYVAATRARHRLVIAAEASQYRMEALDR